MIAKVLINTTVKNLNRVYDYNIPKELEEQVELGKRVEVNFGKSRKKNEEGIIVKIVDETEEEIKNRNYELKDIISILDETSYIDENRLKLAKYISYMYFCNVYDALKLMLPPGTTSKNSSKNLNTKQDTRVRLVKSSEEINQDIESGKISSAKHIRLLRFLIDNEFVVINDIIDGLNISRAVINTVQKNGYITLEKFTPEVDLLENFKIEKTTKKEPTTEQRHAINEILNFIYEEKYEQCLLFGVTGSGKTEVYLQVLEEVLKQGRKAIVLVPEISLTYQTVNRFVSRFGNNVAILHSRMSVSKRKEEYKRIKNGEVDIVIGARSAIFAPIKNLGIVIIDEEHDGSYYSGSTPKYSTKEIASYICKEQNAVLLLGSATPEISTYYKAKTGKIKLLTMTKRPEGATLPQIDLINMKEERLLGNTSVISEKLKEELLNTIKRKEQALLFLNRRGYTSYLTCKDCSTIFKCPNCDVALTYHKSNNLLLCHYCSHVEKNITVCPKCGSNNLSTGTIGTQKLEETLKEIYPEITTIRMDADSTIQKDAHQKILDKFKNENINVLIGTQMISKGHDIPNVTLVGVLGVDSLIAINDCMAAEKAFANISQVSGRAGRAKLKGKVIIQTNDTENYILQAVKNHDYIDFYEKEIQFRKNFGFPPFLDIFLFEFSSKNFNILKAEVSRMYNILLNDKSGIYKVFSPKSPYVQRINNKYRMNILIKTKVSNEFYNLIYNKINEFSNKRKKEVTMSVTKNPTFIS